VIAGQQHDEAARMGFDDVDVLIDRVRRPDIPHRFRNTLAGRKNIEAFVALRAKEIPTHLQVADEAVGFVLRCHRDAPNSGVESIRERKVDDAGFSAEIDGRLGTSVRQL
jgi:hypothetical protein